MGLIEWGLGINGPLLGTLVSQTGTRVVRSSPEGKRSDVWFGRWKGLTLLRWEVVPNGYDNPNATAREIIPLFTRARRIHFTPDGSNKRAEKFGDKYTVLQIAFDEYLTKIIPRLQKEEEAARESGQIERQLIIGTTDVYMAKIGLLAGFHPLRRAGSARPVRDIFSPTRLLPVKIAAYRDELVDPERIALLTQYRDRFMQRRNQPVLSAAA